MRLLDARRKKDGSKNPTRANRPHHRRVPEELSAPPVTLAPPIAQPAQPAPPVPGPTLLMTAVQLGPGAAPPQPNPQPPVPPAVQQAGADGAASTPRIHVHSTGAPDRCRGARRRRGQPSAPLPQPNAGPSGFPTIDVECRRRKLTKLEERALFES